MTIRLAERLGEFIMSSEDGERLGAELGRAIDAGDEVELDFSGVRSVLSAFLNPAVGALYDGRSADEVDRRLRVVHLSDVQLRSVEAVREHARRFYNDADYRNASRAALDAMFS